MGSTESDQFFLFRFNILVLLILQYCSLTNTAQPKYFPTYIYHFCLGGNYSTTTGRTYRNNLDNLLSSLSSLQSSLVISNGYYYNHYGENPDTVYGAGQCNCDSRSRTCKDCVDSAAKDIIGSDRCPNSKGAIIWYDECMLRYSNESFISIMQENPSVHLGNTANIKNPDLFIRILGGLMDNLTKEAVSSTGSSDTSLFASGETMFTEFQKIYGLVQCTFDLSHNSCNRCLLRAIAQLLTYWGGKQGGRVMQPSCYCRYEIYPFFQSTAPQAAPALLRDPKPPSTNNTTTKSKGKNSSKLVVSIVVPSVIAVLLTIGIWCFCFWRKKAMKRDDLVNIESAESLQFNFSTIRAATDNFCFANKLGEGGFGSVYKGTLSDGQEIAVKRLSRNSVQGDEEFKNEVALVVKLQHRNLVRLLGFCLHGQERLLIYEFMPNASLDHFIFDPIKRSYLDWERRYTIVGGIARGLLYLHEDSRLRIIHRDLKASNVLLGADMNPKISDFGMARMFIMNQTQANTDRIVGTYGYMAPEYAMHGHFSVKSDVFSFGVLVLEILSGWKNNSFYGSEGAQDLLSYAWERWKEGTTIEFLDSTLREHHSRIEVMRCIHIGLLCVQEDISNRPTMASIVNMLNNNSVNLKTPSSPPVFFVNSRKERSGPSASGESSVTVDGASITELHPR